MTSLDKEGENMSEQLASAVKTLVPQLNKFDSEFGNKMASLDVKDWTFKQARAIYFVLRKYQDELDNLGIDYSDLVEPANDGSYRQIHKSIRTIEVDKNNFVLRFPYEPEIVAMVKTIPSAQWNPSDKIWTFSKTKSAISRFVELARTYKFEGNVDVRNATRSILSEQNDIIDNMPVEGVDLSSVNLDLDSINGDPFPFQLDGAKFAMATKQCIIGDEQGLGKTIQALMAMHSANAYPFLIVCPSTLKLNWENEIKKWLPKKKIRLIKGGRVVGKYRGNDITIINYDILKKHESALRDVHFKGIILDESHKIKSRDAQRTRSAIELCKDIEYRFLLTGTPVLNKPVEIITQLRAIDALKQFGGFMQFARRYCGAAETRFGLDLTGAKNLTELNEKLRSFCYVRRTKDEVLPDLPEKMVSILPVDLSPTARATYKRIQRDVIQWLRENMGDDRANSAARAETLVKINLLKTFAMRGKMESAKKWIEDFLESGEKLVVFADHIEAQQELVDAFPGCLHVMSKDSAKQRQDAIDKFQNDSDSKLMICSLGSGGVGITLTAATNVAFLELGWTPAQHDQAEDRLHRIGQTGFVNVWYLLGKDTIDEDIWDLIQRKRQVVTRVTDGKAPGYTASIMNDLVDKMMRKDVR